MLSAMVWFLNTKNIFYHIVEVYNTIVEKE